MLIGGSLWTRQAVVELTYLVVGVDMTEQGVGLWLRRHGFTPQRPARRAYEQQPAVRAWLDEDYWAIEARAKIEGAAIAWVDQCGLRSDAAPPGRSWAPKGRTPIVRVTGKRLRVNIMSAVASCDALWFTVFTERFTAPVFTAFLDRVAGQAGRNVHVVADRHPVHCSKAVRAWLEANTDRVELHLMPGYSPRVEPGRAAQRRPETQCQRLPSPQHRPARPRDSPVPAPSPATVAHRPRLLLGPARPLRRHVGNRTVST
ncbi:IS630 family transposase [Saccharothrix lopnurensis]|uniref:IS630 family transposase n=1 Tax=Saccharothrix lopnurensis TaxID=1670621 RepID=A0ABW1P899_9PSEU